MFLKKIIIQVGNSSDFDDTHQIKISPSLYRRWPLNTQKPIFLQFGSQLEEVKISETPSLKTMIIEITPALAAKLYIPFELLPIHCLYNQEENTLKLGPIISCITNQMYHQDWKFGSMTNFFEQLANYSKLHHIFFFVHPLLEWKEQFHGFSFQNGEWHPHLFPTPNSIYNRISSRNFESSNVFNEFTNYLYKKEIKFFNDKFLDKWEIHNVLSYFPEIIPYLPETTIFEDYETFADKLTRYNCIFLKPVNGSKGRQILRIEKQHDEYIVYYSSFSTETYTIFKSSYLLYKRLKERLNKQPFLIQQGLDLIQIEDRPLDFRILVVKDRESLWKVVSSVARISPKKRMVSNLAQGGEQKRPLEVLTNLYDENLSLQYLKLMGELAIEVAALISGSYDGLFGELGIDIALDEYGKLWIIEINSKPSKVDDNIESVRPSTKAIIAYLTHLSGFSLQNRHDS